MKRPDRLIVIFVIAIIVLLLAYKYCKNRNETFHLTTASPVRSFKKCVNVHDLKLDMCVTAEVIPSTLTLVYELIINGKVYYKGEMEENHICLNDEKLLELMADVPALAPYKSIIDDLIAELGYIPGHVLSVCLDLKRLSVTQHEAIGCFQLRTTLMCWEGKCLYKNTEKFPCFRIHY